MNMQKSSNKLDTIFNSYYECKLISRGDNFPDFNPVDDSLDLFLVALHEKLDIKFFQKRAGWSDEFLQEKIDFLKSKNWLKGDENLRSEEHTPELQSHPFTRYAVFCLKKKNF